MRAAAFCFAVPSLPPGAAGTTLKTLKALMKEMSELFTDEIFNIGCDETAAKGPCTVKSTFDLERQVQ